MAAPRLLTCPICAQPGFPSVDALRSGLACAATRPLACPVCADVLLGLDKFTVHLFAHSLQQHQRGQAAPAIARCELCAFDFPDEGLLHLHRRLAHGDVPRLAPPSPRPGRKHDASVSPHDYLPLLRPQGDSFTQQQLQQLCAQVRSQLQAEQAQQMSLHRARQRPSVTTDSHAAENFLSSHQSQHGDKRKGRFDSSQEKLHQPQLEQVKQEPVKHLVKNHRNERQIQFEQQQLNGDRLTQNTQLQLKQQICEERNLKHTQLQHQVHKHQRLQEVHRHGLDQRECEQQQLHHLHQQQEQEVQKHQQLLQQRQQNEQQHQQRQQQQPEQQPPQQHVQQQQQQQHQQTQQQPQQQQLQQQQQERQQQQQKQQHQQLQQQQQRQQLQQQQHQQQQQLQQQQQQQLQHEQGQEQRQQQQQQLLPHPEAGREQEEKQQGNSNESEKAAFPCHLCSKIFKMRGSLMVHLRVAHSGINAGKILRSWVESAQQLHQQEPDAKNFTCSSCGKTFKKEHQLTQHQKTHEGKQWECDVCSKLFTTKYFLKKHKRLHTGEMPYSCPTCNKTFTFQQSYHKHLLYHSDEKPHVCTECDRAFKELSTLHNHQRIHTGEKPFACETCGKCFRQRVSYLVHRRIHTGAMPYQCTACGKNFRYKVSQRTHKCPAQPPGVVVRQSGELVQRLLQGVQHRLSEPLTAGKASVSASQTAVNDVMNDRLLASKELAKQLPNRDQSCEVDNTVIERSFPNEDHQLPQQNNQFIILLEGNTHNSFPPGLLVVAPPLFMLPPETNAKDLSAPWTSQETSTSSQELSCSNSNVVNNVNSSNSFSESEKVINIIQSDSDSFVKKDKKIEPKQREITDTEVSRIEPDNGDIPNEEWFRMDSEKSLSQLEINRSTTTSNSPELAVQTTDFFTMVMSPPQTTGLPSPSEGLRQLTLSPPDDVNHQDQSGTLFQFFMPSGNAQTSNCTSKAQSSDILSPTTQPRANLQSLDSNCSSKILHSDIEASSSLSGSSELQTINEESLKQLLYGTSL